MFGLSRLLQLTGNVDWRLHAKDGRRSSRRSSSRRRTSLEMQELEPRVVPTLLGQQLFPSDNPWNQNIASAPVAANSAAVIANIGSSVHVHADWGADSAANGNSPLYGIPFNIVHGNSTAKVNVVIDNYPGESDVVPVPIGANAVIEGDYQDGPNNNGAGYNANQRGDSHLIIWDEDNDIAYELFGVSRPSDPTLFPNTDGVELPHTDGQWHAAQETVWYMKTDTFRTLGETSADAAGLSILAGLVRPDEGLTVAQGGQGAIDHAIRFTLPASDVNPQYIYPASHEVDESQGSSKLPFGARLRLENTAAVNAIIAAMPPESQIIAHAMQQYGLILADIGSSMYVTGASATVDNVDSPNTDLTWNMNDIFASNGIESLTAGDFQVVSLTPIVTGLSTSNAAVGSTILVNGQNFSGAAGHLSVLFGSTPSTSVTVLSDTQLSVVIPSGTGTVNVTVQSGVDETDTISDNPNANVTAPVWGYGVSATSSADLFTYSSASYSLTAGALTPPTAVEGTAFSNVTVFHFTDSNPAATVSNYTAQVALGNGSTVTLTSTASANGQIVANPSGGYDVKLSYTYPSSFSGKTFSVAVTAADGESTSATDSNFSVADAPLTASPVTFAAVENSAVSGVTVATFRDANPDGQLSQYSATISWGDGDTTASESIVADAHVAGQFDVIASKSHPYTSGGSFPVTVVISDAGGATATAHSTATVSASTSTITVAGSTISGTEGAAFSGTVATFVDSNTSEPTTYYTAAINWGDGSTSAGTVQATSTAGHFNVTGTHTYAAAGTYTAVVTVTEGSGASSHASTTAKIADAALSGSAVSFSAVKGKGFSGEIATFKDANPLATLSSYSATVNWGDGGTSTATVATNPSGGFEVQGTHTYTKTGTFTFTVTINDVGGSTLSVRGTATVKRSGVIIVGGGGTSNAAFAIGGTSNPVFALSPSGDLSWYQSGGWTAIGSYIDSASVTTNGTGQPVVFAVTTNQDLMRFDPTNGWVELGAGIQSVSATTSSSGLATAFAITTNQQLYRFDTTYGWALLGSYIQSVSATTDAAGQPMVFAVTTGNTLARFDGGWTQLGASISSVSATNAGGQPVVFAVTLNNDLFRFGSSTGWTMLGSNIQSVSAGTDANGNAKAYAVTTANGLFADTVSGWQTVTPPVAASALTAGSADTVFAWASNGAAYQYGDTTGWLSLGTPVA